MPLARLDPLLKLIRASKSRFLYGLEKVPDERLEWSPGGEARTPLQQAGRTAGFLQAVAHLARERTFPDRSGPQPPVPQTRAEAVAAAAAGFDAVEAVVSALTEEDLKGELMAPWGRLV